jgi:hypothetical protein
MITAYINDLGGKRLIQVYGGGKLQLVKAKSPAEGEAVLRGLNAIGEILEETGGDRELLRHFLAVLDREVMTGDFRDRHPRPCYCSDVSRALMFSYLTALLRHEARG